MGGARLSPTGRGLKRPDEEMALWMGGGRGIKVPTGAKISDRG